MPEKIPLKDVEGKIYVCKDCGATAKHRPAEEKVLTSFNVDIKQEKGATFIICKSCRKEMATAN